MNPLFLTDGYKLDHRRAYPDHTQFVYSNWTARGSRLPDVNHVTFLGLQAALKKLQHLFDTEFFNRPLIDVTGEYFAMLQDYLGRPAAKEIGTKHISALHELGYLPLEFKALPEGTPTPLRVPMFTVENTHPDFFWLTNYFETFLSAELWLPCTTATLAGRLRTLLNEWALKTAGSTEGVAFQGHDFSMRGMAGVEAATLSALGHLVHFTGTETVPVLQALKDLYPSAPDHFIAGTVPATEHSVMCAGGEDNERDTFSRLLDLYPTGILSVVSDTWDFWNTVTQILPSLYDQITQRDGKLVIRPDSGDPADIICGTNPEFDSSWDVSARKPGPDDAPKLGAIETLWHIFGGTINEQGYKVLDPHVGLIYGDSMNYDRINDICARLAAKGFASTNLVFGVGSFSYQYQTRDTFGFAMKATNVTIDGRERAIFKDPKTDSGLKKSLKGRIAVGNGVGLAAASDYTPLVALDDEHASERDYAIENGLDLLRPVWADGHFVNELGFDEVRANAGSVQ